MKTNKNKKVMKNNKNEKVMGTNKKEMVMETNKNVNLDKSESKTTTKVLEKERKNYSDYLYQNTTEFNLKELNERATMKQKEKFLQDALVTNEKQKLAKIESFDRYDLVATRITEHYETLNSTNSSLTMKDLSVQTHLLLLPEKFVNPSKINKVISRTLRLMWDNIRHGKVVMVNENLLFDSLKFQDKVVPICVINGKLVPLKYIIKFTSLDLANNYEILNAFAKILENALSARFYVKLDDEIIVLRKGKKGDEQNQLFISEISLKGNFANIKKRERSKEVYDELNLEDIVSNKTKKVISLEESKKPFPKVMKDDKSKKAAKKTTTKKAPAKKTTAKKTESKNSSVKKPAAKKLTTTKGVTKNVAKKPVKTTTKKAKTTTKKTTKKDN